MKIFQKNYRQRGPTVLRFAAFAMFMLGAGQRVILDRPAGALIAVGLALQVLAQIFDGILRGDPK
jgi:hypothetical protein